MLILAFLPKDSYGSASNSITDGYRNRVPKTTFQRRGTAMLSRKGHLRAVVLLAMAALLTALAPAALAQSPAQRVSNGIVAFVTDWGERDFYVGAAKGVALSIFPEVTLVDISHYVEPYDIMEGAVTLIDRKSTRLNSSHVKISYAVFCLKKKTAK